jgi:DNA modification methylase
MCVKDCRGLQYSHRGYRLAQWDIRTGNAVDVLAEMVDESVQTVITSPPFWGLRDYGDLGHDWPEVRFAPMPGLADMVIPAQTAALGLEADPWSYVGHLVAIFREVRRVLRKDGTVWLNLGDSFAGGGRAGKNPEYHDRHTMFGKTVKPSEHGRFGLPQKVPEGLKKKDLVGIPWRVAYALQADGWWLRSDIVWAKPNPMPESCTDRPSRAHEMLFLLTRRPKYYYDADAIREPDVAGHVSRRTERTENHQTQRGEFGTSVPWDKVGGGRNARSVWNISVRPYRGAHFATFPPDLPERCIKAGTKVGGVVLDPFSGAATTGLVATRLGRQFIGIEQNEEYAALGRKRISDDAPLFNQQT